MNKIIKKILFKMITFIKKLTSYYSIINSNNIKRYLEEKICINQYRNLQKKCLNYKQICQKNDV